jgi:hypothetical protein
MHTLRGGQLREAFPSHHQAAVENSNARTASSNLGRLLEEFASLIKVAVVFVDHLR